jgi:16S rRNA (adenine1518-N6/adenine1519-N6)-dimethyltransferase
VVRAKKSLGQNFLVDPNVQRRIVDAVGAGSGDEVLEIGPGQGALTRLLAERVGRLVAVELDDALAAGLRDEFAGRAEVEILHADALRVGLEDVSRRPESLRVVGNIPYNITTPLIFWLLERRPRPADIVLMVQREVADRILAEPGTKAYGALSVGVRSVAEARRLFHVGRGAFRPVPDVDSTVLRITPWQPPRHTAAEEAALRTLTRAAFSWRRKQLRTTLREAPEYRAPETTLDRVERESGIDLTRRPETVAPEDFFRLAAALRGERGGA